ncbi:variant erythrocyte surface antigen-1 family protein, partial [Babesia divergens]
TKVLAGLEACLHLQCLQADMNEICGCKADDTCCLSGTCDGKSGGSGGKSCDFCEKLQSSTPLATTGLGLSPPNPIRLAKRLDKFFGGKSSFETPCDCSCKGSTSIFSSSCCCLACGTGKCSKACSPGCLCLKSGPCPRQKFCLAIQNVKVTAQTSLMRCCDSGKKCHCQVDPSNCQSGSGCCETGKKSVKCLLRRLVTYFNSLGPNPSQSEFSKKCCELLCVAKTCEFLWSFYNDTKYKSDSKPFHDALQTLKHSSPCGHDLWRTLDDFLYYCVHMVGAHVDRIKDKINAKGNTCKKCGKPGKSPCDCNNKCNGQCKGCDVLLGDSHFMAILTRKFSSSYDSSKAKWNLLCSHTSQCSGCLKTCRCRQSVSSFPSVSYCAADPCCDYCDVRKAAKIFLGFLPCMYWGLKILYDRAQDPVTWPDWQKISVSYGNPSSGLAKFLYAWGYDVKPLKNKKGFEFFLILKDLFGSDSSGPLQKLSTLVTEKYFTSHLISSTPKDPQTVREMLLWLYGLRFTSGFHDLVSHCSSLCIPFGNSFNADSFCYYIYTCCSLLPVSVISFIETSDSTAAKFFSSAEWKSFSYPEDPFKLFETFCDFVRKIYIPLTFIRFQCQLGPSQAGWRDCYFGQNCSVSSSSVSSASPSGCNCKGHETYLCTWTNSNWDVHSNSCPSSGSSCNAKCPHPLQRFLIDDFSDSTSQSSVSKSLFALPGTTPMGFSNLSSTGKSGESLHGAIKYFCLDGFYPLTRLTEFSFCIFRNPPDTLGELFAFFRKFAEALNSKTDLSSTFVQWINGEPGFYSGSDLKSALENLKGSSHSSSHIPANLFSLSGCHATKGSGTSPPTCGPYLHALTEEVSGVFTPELCSMYLSWICYLAKDFYSEFQKFHTAAQKKFSCCKSCQKIVECPCALPFLYSQGFTFLSPGGLNCVDAQGKSKHGSGWGKHYEGKDDCTTKSCSDFVSQLGLVVNGQPFKDLLKVIDAFIWSIRLPFIYAFLYIWILVISYFYYVQFYKLDLLHLKSHAHFSRSFKILPSTLFSDASSKLKDLSYFTL